MKPLNQQSGKVVPVVSHKQLTAATNLGTSVYEVQEDGTVRFIRHLERKS